MAKKTTPKKTTMTLVGCGGMARHHIRQILKQVDTTQIAVVCEPSLEAYDAASRIFTQAGLEPAS